MKKIIANITTPIMLIIFLIATSCGKSTIDITKHHLRELIREDQVDKIVVNSENRVANIYLTDPEGYSRNHEFDLSGKGPHLRVKISDEAHFIDFVYDLQSEYPEAGSVHIIQQHGKQSFGEFLLQWGFLVFLLAPLSLLLILVSIIDIMLLRTDQKTERLTWVIVIIFVPLVGAVLYLLKGRKRIKQENTRN